MGQALRRAASRHRTPTTTPTPSSSSLPSSRFPNSLDPPSPSVPSHKLQDQSSTPLENGDSKSNTTELEERDSNYEAMLNQMVGRISTKPGGKLEMGEAFVVRKSNRPMPKLRNTSVDTGRYEERPVAAGTLNVAQLRHIMLMRQGKADEQGGPMGPREIAERFRLDPVQVERIFQFVSLPPEDTKSKKRHEFDD